MPSLSHTMGGHAATKMRIVPTAAYAEANEANEQRSVKVFKEGAEDTRQRVAAAGDAHAANRHKLACAATRT